MKLTADDYATLHRIVFGPNYPGYRPDVLESPNGDGVVDAKKRYAHVSCKYLGQFTPPRSEEEFTELDYLEAENARILRDYLKEAHENALSVAVSMGVPSEFWPSYVHGALRVLEYPPGAGSAEHTDPNLFTLNLYRNIPEALVSQTGEDSVHCGELLSEIMPHICATSHSVKPQTAAQYSVVYFAIPEHHRRLSSGQTVGEWIEERMSRRRFSTSAVSAYLMQQGEA